MTRQPFTSKLKTEAFREPAHSNLPNGFLQYQEIKCISQAPAWHHMIPNGLTSTLITLSGTFQIFDPATPGQVTEHTQVLLGLRTRTLQVRLTRNIDAIAVLMTPRAAYSLTKTEPQDLVNAWMDLDSEYLPGLSGLPALVAATPDRNELWAGLDAFFAERLLLGREQSAQVAAAWSRLEAAGGMTRVDKLAEHVGWSRRQLENKFREQIGISPKSASRVLRLRRAVDLFLGGQPAAEIAALCGFSDQPHFSREFKSMTGLTPRQLLAADLPQHGLYVKPRFHQTSKKRTL